MFFCHNEGHYKSKCKFLKKKKEKKGSSSGANKNLVAMIFKINLLEGDNAWWVDSGATRHVCKNKNFFKTMKPVDDGTILFMGNSTTTPVLGIGDVELKFTSGSILTLTNVFYVPEVRKNLVSGGLLNKFGFKLVFEADKFVLSKGGLFVGKGYLCDGMFKLNVDFNKNIDISVYMVEPSFLWHHRLGHVNFRRLHDMIKMDLLPYFETSKEKCTTCMLTKITKNHFPK